MAGLAKPRNIIELIKSFGLEDTSTSRKQGLKDVLDQLQLSAGFNLIYPVNDCESASDFSESADGEFDIEIEDSTKKVGSYSIKLTATTAESGYVSTDKIVESGPIPTDSNGDQYVDWSDSDYIGWWQYNAGMNTDGELKFRIKNNGVWSDAIDVPGGTDGVWQRVELDISGLSRTRVEAIRFDNNAPVNEYVYIDDIIRYKHGNGKGPVLGPCISFPIKNGETISRGNLVGIQAGSVRRLSTTVSGEEDLGPCVVGGTGNSQGTVYATVQIGGLAYLRAGGTIVAGEGVKRGSNHTVVGAVSGQDEMNLGKAIEASTANSDFLVLISKAVTYVS
ncbi:MAG: hypothetical protein ACTSWW_11340 [Promethearchaeota archaeon]